MRSTALILLLLLAPLAAAAQPGAPPVDARQLPTGILDLTHNWRAQEGDNPAWSAPNLDDRNWPVEALDSSAASQPGWRWFRLTLRLPQDSAPPLSLLLDGRKGAYELYIDGRRIPGPALLPPLLVTDSRDRAFLLPAHADVVYLALRVHIAKRVFERAPAFRSAFIGPAAAVAVAHVADHNARLEDIGPSFGVNLAFLLAGIGCVGLYFAQERRGEYLWLGIALLSLGAGAAAFILYYFSFVPVSVNWFFAIPVNYILTFALIEFLFRFANRRITRPWRAYQCVLLAIGFGFPFLVWFGILGYGPYNIIEALVLAPGSLLLTVLLFRWYVAGNREAGWLIIPTMFPSTMLAWWDTGVVMQYFGAPLAARFLRPISIGPWAIRIFDLGDGLFLLAIGVVMFFRFSRVSLQQARAASEFEAARAVQQVIVPEAIPAVPGFPVNAVYKPAGEVGGDFYQIVPTSSGGVLAVIGDVSGKGMPAAMTVSLLVGTFRTLAHYTQGPGEILGAMNQRMCGRNSGGFTTCLVLRIDPGGAIAAASAGHLAPYIYGHEVPLGSGLPLGLSEDFVYSESTLSLAPGAQLTLLTDGVVEAQSPTGELFGFDRTAAISTQSAESIAAAAQQFGQEDDITVLTLTFAPAEVLHA